MLWSLNFSAARCVCAGNSRRTEGVLSWTCLMGLQSRGNPASKQMLSVKKWWLVTEEIQSSARQNWENASQRALTALSSTHIAKKKKKKKKERKEKKEINIQKLFKKTLRQIQDLNQKKNKQEKFTQDHGWMARVLSIQDSLEDVLITSSENWRCVNLTLRRKEIKEVMSESAYEALFFCNGFPFSECNWNLYLFHTVCLYNYVRDSVNIYSLINSHSLEK